MYSPLHSNFLIPGISIVSDLVFQLAQNSRGKPIHAYDYIKVGHIENHQISPRLKTHKNRTSTIDMGHCDELLNWGTNMDGASSISQITMRKIAWTLNNK